MEGVGMNEKGYSKFVIARDFVFKSKCMFGGGFRLELLRELRRFPELIFRPQMYQKRLAAGLRPDPLGELERSPRTPSRSGCCRQAVKPCQVTSPHWFQPQIAPWGFPPQAPFLFSGQRKVFTLLFKTYASRLSML